MAVDGNALVHRSFHALARTGARTTWGEPMWAIQGLLTQLVAAADRVGPQHIVVGFDDPEVSIRRQRWPEYKAQRAAKLPALVRQLARAAEVLAELGVHVVQPAGLEADDVLASVARQAPALGRDAVLVSSDRDAFALIGDHTRVLRVINGGVEGSPMLTPERLVTLIGVPPHCYPDFAALRGDPSDNLPGVLGIGPKRAAALLGRFGTAQAAFDSLAEDSTAVADLLGPSCAARLADPEAPRRWRSNREAMAFVDDLDCGLADDPPPGALPFERQTVRRVLIGHNLPATALLADAVLGHGPPPRERAERPVVDRLAWDSRAEWQARTRPGHDSTATPTRRPDRQPTLF